MQIKKTQKIILGEDFGDVNISANGARVEISAGGNVVVHTNGKAQNPPVAAVNDDGYIPENGERIKNKGSIFIGIWEPKDRDGKSLGKTFNLYAASEDLTDTTGRKALLTFRDLVRRVSRLRNWHGRNGGNFENDTALYEALRSGSYNGEWFIPPSDIVTGMDLNGKYVQSDNLHKYKDREAFKGTFTDDPGSGSARWYQTCTELPGDASSVIVVDFWRGDRGHFYKDYSEHTAATRPVWAEPRP